MRNPNDLDFGDFLFICVLVVMVLCIVVGIWNEHTKTTAMQVECQTKGGYLIDSRREGAICIDRNHAIKLEHK